MKTKTHKVDMGHTTAKRKLTDDLWPVSPRKSGQGLPYAPVDCPNPGDIWRWAATGKTIKANGIYKDRLLYAPERLQRNSSKKLAFMSKISVVRYLQAEFPEVDINAFFGSFTWDIPATTDSIREGNSVTCSKSVASQKENRRLDRVGGIFRRTRRSSVGRKSQGPSGAIEFIDMTIEEEGTQESGETIKRSKATSIQDDQVSDSRATGSADGNACSYLLDSKLRTSNFTVEEFDNYLSSLDEFFAITYPVSNVPSKNGGVEARQKLSSLLAMGFPSLISSNKLNELLALTSELQNDPSLSDKEHSTLKLIQEIPSAGQRYLELKEASAQAEKFFADLDSRLVSVASLKNEYNNAKEEKEVLQAEEASTVLAMLETNDEIEKLQARRMALAENIKKTNKMIVRCDSTQRKVMDCLPQIVNEVKVANTEKAEWELKKKKSAEEEVEILAKFAALVGFSFDNLS